MEDIDRRLRMSIPDYLKELSIRQSTDNLDDQIVGALIQKIIGKHSNTTVTCGLIYIKPYTQGPISVQQFAKVLIDKMVI